VDVAASPELTIGEFARRTGLSAKALRLYDERGLLRPIRVDPVSGYRYYEATQIQQARTIALLRRLELPLVDVAEVIGLPPDHIEPRLRDWWTGRHRRLDDRHGTLELVIRALAPAVAEPHPPVDGFDPAAVEVVSLPARTVAAIRREVAQDELVATFTADALEIRRRLDDTGARFDGGYWVEYHGAVGPGIVGPIETCVPYEGTAAPAGDIVLRAEPTRRAAALDLSAADCSYPRIMAVYAALDAWVEANAEPSAPVREMYLGPWCADGLVGRLVQPIA
jgi:DNA-binding transcriptional MerR regulator